MLFFSAVNAKALELLREIQDHPLFKNFYLVGGTALALRYGHRVSIDLDFFTENEFDAASFIDSLKEKYTIVILAQSKNALTLSVNSVKTDFIRHNYPLLRPIEIHEGLRIVSVEDIAAMKLNSVMNRGSKKDFFDVYELLKHFSLGNLIAFHSEKYDFSSDLVVLKSLVYFEDAEKEPDPISMNFENWQLVKEKIIEAVSFYGK